MFNTLRRAGVLAISALVVPGVLAAQLRQTNTRAPATPSATTREEARAWVNEMNQIRARLQAAHQRAMQDQQLRAAQDQLMRDVKAAMLRADPALDSLSDRVEAMKPEAEAAQRSGDRARLQALQREMARIQTRFTAAQERAMQQPSIVQRSRTFEAQLKQRLLTVEPQTEQLLARANELQARLLRVAQQQRQPPQPQAGPTRSRAAEANRPD